MNKVIAEKEYARTAELVKKAAQDAIDEVMAKSIAESEAAIEDGEWVRLISKYMVDPLPVQEVITIVTGMREKGFGRDQVRALLEAWLNSEKQKATMAEKETRQKKASSVPKPEAYGSWA